MNLLIFYLTCLVTCIQAVYQSKKFTGGAVGIDFHVRGKKFGQGKLSKMKQAAANKRFAKGKGKGKTGLQFHKVQHQDKSAGFHKLEYKQKEPKEKIARTPKAKVEHKHFLKKAKTGIQAADYEEYEGSVTTTPAPITTPPHKLHKDTSSGKFFYLTTDGLVQFFDNSTLFKEGDPVRQNWQQDENGEFFMYIPDPSSNNSEDTLKQYYTKQGQPMETPVYNFTSEWVNTNGMNLFMVTNTTGGQHYLVNDDCQFIFYNLETGKTSYLVVQPWVTDYNNVTFLWQSRGNRVLQRNFRNHIYIVDANGRARFYNDKQGKLSEPKPQPWLEDPKTKKKYIWAPQGHKQYLHTDNGNNQIFILTLNGLVQYYDPAKNIFKDPISQPIQVDDEGNKFMYDPFSFKMFMHFDTTTGGAFFVDKNGLAMYYDIATNVFNPPQQQNWQKDERNKKFLYAKDGKKLWQEKDTETGQFYYINENEEKIILSDLEMQTDMTDAMASMIGLNTDKGRYSVDEDGNYFLVLSDGSKQYYDIQTGEMIEDPHGQVFHLDPNSQRYFLVVEGNLAQFYNEQTGEPDGDPIKQPWQQDEITGQYYLYTMKNTKEYYDLATGQVVSRSGSEDIGFLVDPVDGRYYLVDPVLNTKQYYDINTGLPEGEPIPLEVEESTQEDNSEDMKAKAELSALASQKGLLMDLQQAMIDEEEEKRKLIELEIAKNKTLELREEAEAEREKQRALASQEIRIDWHTAIMNFNHSIPTKNNPNFIIFNKLYRNAGVTLKRILTAFSKKNSYDFFYSENTENENDHNQLIEKVKNIKRQTDKLLIYKPHNFFKAKNYNKKLKQPTWISFIRDPFDMFASDWYYCRYGSDKRPKGPKDPCLRGKDRRFLGINQCILEEGNECMKTKFSYSNLLCGGAIECYTNRYMSYTRQKALSDKTKRRILMDYRTEGSNVLT